MLMSELMQVMMVSVARSRGMMSLIWQEDTSGTTAVSSCHQRIVIPAHSCIFTTYTTYTISVRFHSSYGKTPVPAIRTHWASFGKTPGGGWRCLHVTPTRKNSNSCPYMYVLYYIHQMVQQSQSDFIPHLARRHWDGRKDCVFVSLHATMNKNRKWCKLKKLQSNVMQCMIYQKDKMLTYFLFLFDFALFVLLFGYKPGHLYWGVFSKLSLSRRLKRAKELLSSFSRHF